MPSAWLFVCAVNATRPAAGSLFALQQFATRSLDPALARRQLFGIIDPTDASEALARIAALYEIEAWARGKPAPIRLALRQAESAALVADLRVWFEMQLAKLPSRSTTADAINYALNHWNGLVCFLEDGRIDLDTNSIERAMRPVALSRKNSLFCGSDEGGENWACQASLIETCKLNGVNPLTYITDVLTRLVNGWPQDRINELMPWHWAPPKPN